MDDESEERLVYGGSDEDNRKEQKEKKMDKIADGHLENLSNINSNENIEMEQTSADQSSLHNTNSTEPSHDVSQAIDQTAEDESDDDIFVKSSIKNTAKRNILISDDESECDEEPQPSLHYSDSESENNDEGANVVPGRLSERPTICDSDSNSSGKDLDSDNIEESIKKATKTKKILKRKERVRSSKQIANSDSDSSSDSSAENEVEVDNTAASKLKSLCDDDSQDSSASSDDSSRFDVKNSDGADIDLPKEPREKPQQRKAAKVAEDQMKEITSESQRLARDIYINVPYHRPKQFSLKEFMSRRTISKPTGFPALQKTAAAIKMSDTDLALYARSLEERAEEAIRFFENDNFATKANNKMLNANEQENFPKNEENTETVQKTQNDTNDAIDLLSLIQENDLTENSLIASNVNLIEDDPNKMIKDAEEAGQLALAMDTAINAEPHIQCEVNENSSTAILSNPIAGTSVEHTEPNSKFTGFHTEQTDLDKELETMSMPIVKHKTILLDTGAPRLSGSKGMVIDFDSNEIKVAEKAGVDELFERFLKNSRKFSTPSDSIEVSIFSSEKGVLETHTLGSQSTAIKDKEPKPGEAFFKLKNELSKKITDKRKEIIAKRIQEEQKNAQENDTDEEIEEFSDCEEQEEDNEQEADIEEQEDEEIEIVKGKNLIDNEASDDETNGPLSEDEDEESLQIYEDEEDSDTSDQDNQGFEQGDDDAKPKRSRILAAFEDSDDEDKSSSQRRLSESCVTTIQNALSPNIFESAPTNDQSQQKSDTSFDFMCSAAFDIKTPPSKFGFQRAIDTPTILFSQDNDADAIGESQLEALCSGTFMTQLPRTIDEDGSQTDAISQIRKALVNGPVIDDTNEPQLSTKDVLAALLSSDDESNLAPFENKKKKLKKHRKPLGFSDDEDEDKDVENKENKGGLADDDEQQEDEEQDIERYVEYDSDENEVEVMLKKKDVKLKASDFFEDEAELSESEWGSADEDEKDLDKFEHELGDEDEFDREKLHSELERIRLREQIDQDAREVRIIKEMLFEEEEDKGDRERKFRWKHLDNANLSELIPSGDGDEAAGNESDDDNESEWRRLRHEREQMLLNQQIVPSEPQDNVLPTAYDEENNISIAPNMSSACRRTSIVKNVNNSSYIQSPFLIGKTASVQKGRKSFLGRDDKTLEKLLNLTKTTAGGEAVANTANTKGHYLFTATDKPQVLKRRSENLVTDGESPIQKVVKKPRLSKGGEDTSKAQPKCMFELLNKR